MSSSIVITLTGPDRVGIVEEVTRTLLELGGNLGSGQMMRLGGEFAILALVTLPAEKIAEVGHALEPLTAAGYKLTVSETRLEPDMHAGWLPYRVEVRGADHEGIVYEIARHLSSRGISIESAETSTTSAPSSGTELFTLSALVLVPPELPEIDWMTGLAAAAEQSGVDVEVTEAD